jgi:hypothetical protein
MECSNFILHVFFATHGIDTDCELCRNTFFKSQGLLQHCAAKEDNYHKATAFYLKGLYDASRKKV